MFINERERREIGRDLCERGERLGAMEEGGGRTVVLFCVRTDSLFV